MKKSTNVSLLSRDVSSRTKENHRLIHEFYSIATDAYINNWGRSFHLPPFTPGQTLQQACAAQERHIAQNFTPGQHIIDLGCGVGGPARTIAGELAGLRITAINIVQDQLDRATRLTDEVGLGHQICFVNADYTNLPFADRTFDGAYSFDALCHSRDKPRTYREIHRTLRPGALFVGTDWMCADGLDADGYRRWAEPVSRYAALPDLLSPSSLSRLLTEAGFTVRSCVDLAATTDLTPNWNHCDEAAMSIANETDSAHQFMYYHCTTMAAAGRAGAFTIGSWVATA